MTPRSDRSTSAPVKRAFCSPRGLPKCWGGEPTAPGRSLHTSEPPRCVGAEILAEGGNVPRPEQVVVDETVEARGRGVLLRRGSSHDGIRRQVDARGQRAAEVEL